MTELEELKLELKIAVKYKFDHNEIIHIENLIKQKEEENARQRKSNVDTIHYPYGVNLI